ncbi:MAG TPA: choice-of-anchor J domain-containing protein [Chitinophagaceae bacterium]
MKKNSFLLMLCLAGLSTLLIIGCKKDSPGSDPGSSKSFTEEFADISNIESKGWKVQNNTTPFEEAGWGQGTNGPSKSGEWHGFPAHSYTSYEGEFAYASVWDQSTSFSVSSWLITPILYVKNGDKISFHTRADTGTTNSERLQVLMNTSSLTTLGSDPSMVGNYTTQLLEINPTLAVGGYPITWTKFEHTFSGLSSSKNVRIAFRYFVPSTSKAKGIGIDVFKFESQ